MAISNFILKFIIAIYLIHLYTFGDAIQKSILQISFYIFALVWSVFLYMHYFCLDLVGVLKLVQTDLRYLDSLSFLFDWSRLD